MLDVNRLKTKNNTIFINFINHFCNLIFQNKLRFNFPIFINTKSQKILLRNFPKFKHTCNIIHIILLLSQNLSLFRRIKISLRPLLFNFDNRRYYSAIIHLKLP